MILIYIYMYFKICISSFVFDWKRKVAEISENGTDATIDIFVLNVQVCSFSGSKYRIPPVLLSL